MNSEKLFQNKLSRRALLKGSAGIALAFQKDFLTNTLAQESTPEDVTPQLQERDPLVLGLALSTVAVSETFKQTRNYEVKLNTQTKTEIEIQNRFDRATLEMFNVMKQNESLLSSGALTSFIANGNIPQGKDTSDFATDIQNTDGEFPITSMFYPEGAQYSAEGVWGQFDAKKGLKVNFTEEYGLFDLTWDAMSGAQNFGFTPRILDDKSLQLDIYLKPEMPPPDHPNYENAPDIVHTWIASNIMQIMTLSNGYKDIYVGNAIQQDKLLFAPPYAVNTVIASEMSNKLPNSINFFDINTPNRSCLFDYAPIVN